MNQQHIPLEIIIDGSHSHYLDNFVVDLRDDMMIGNDNNDITDPLLNLLSEISYIINNENFTTNEQSTINIEPKKYSEIDNNLHSQNECPICLEEFKSDDVVYKLECNHNYHKSCLDTWFVRQNSCPMCKKNIN